MEEKNLRTVIALKLHNRLEEAGIHFVKTELNKNDPSKTVWKYEPSEKFYEILNAYVTESRANKGI